MNETTQPAAAGQGFSEALGATANRGVSVVFLDGHVVTVTETSFSRCLVLAAYQRMQAGGSTHRELTVDVTRCALAVRA